MMPSQGERATERQIPNGICRQVGLNPTMQTLSGLIIRTERPKEPSLSWPASPGAETFARHYSMNGVLAGAVFWWGMPCRPCPYSACLHMNRCGQTSALPYRALHLSEITAAWETSIRGSRNPNSADCTICSFSYDRVKLVRAPFLTPSLMIANW